MALTYSEMVPLKTVAPDFRLPDFDGKLVGRDDARGAKALVVMFICRHCPYVVAVQERLARLARDYQPKGVGFVAINSNDASRYPDDSPANMKKQSSELGFVFPYLVDESQDVARRYGAVCTPDIFVFDREMRLAYRGRIDDSWKDPVKVTRQDLRDALEALLVDKPVNNDQIPSMGCSIKWKQ